MVCRAARGGARARLAAQLPLQRRIGRARDRPAPSLWQPRLRRHGTRNQPEARRRARLARARHRARRNAGGGRRARLACLVLPRALTMRGDSDRNLCMSVDLSPRTELQTTAVFVDFENLALGVEQDKKGRFEIDLVLKRLLERGRIVLKRAYCDWPRFKDFMQEFHRHGFEMVDIPSSRVSGKNSADIRMVVDAIDLCYSKSHIDTFVLVTGDSDFSPLVSKLKENDKRVVGCGVRSSTSDLLANNCDEFIFYDDLIRVQKRAQTRAQTRKRPKPANADNADGTDGADSTDKRKQEAFDRLVATVASLESDYD